MKETIETQDVQPVRLGLGRLFLSGAVGFFMPVVVSVGAFLSFIYFGNHFLGLKPYNLDKFSSDAAVTAALLLALVVYFCALYLFCAAHHYFLSGREAALASVFASSKDALRLSAAYLDGNGVIKNQLAAENHYLTAVAGFCRASKESIHAGLCRSTAAVLEDLAKSDGYMAGNSRKFKDMKVVASSYLRAALLGSKTCQLKVAGFYQEGVGFSRNQLEAYAWFNICAAGGNVEAARARESLASLMTPGHVVLAQERSKVLLAMVKASDVSSFIEA